MMVMQEKDAKDKKKAVQQVLTILFPTKNIIFTPQSILFNDIKDNEGPVLIDQSNFEIL
jgi:hypothetical protein